MNTQVTSENATNLDTNRGAGMGSGALTDRIELKLTVDQKDRWRDAAKTDPRLAVIANDERRLSAWVRLVCDEAAAATLATARRRRK